MASQSGGVLYITKPNPVSKPELYRIAFCNKQTLDTVHRLLRAGERERTRTNTRTHAHTHSRQRKAGLRGGLGDWHTGLQHACLLARILHVSNSNGSLARTREVFIRDQWAVFRSLD